MALLASILFWIIVVVSIGVILFATFTAKVWLAVIIEALVKAEMFFDDIPEGFATAYQKGKEFSALAISQQGFGAIESDNPDLNWSIRQYGTKEEWPEYIDARGANHPAENHTYTKKSFHWDRRFWFIRKIFGENTGIVWMGIWPLVKPKYYHLRINNFRTVPPNKEEIERKTADVRDVKANGQHVGWLVSWTEWTKRILLADDSYPFPVDGVRIGVCLDGKEKQGILANMLIFVRGRIRAPYLFLYRGQDVLEIIQNEIFQQVRKLVASKTVEEVYNLEVTLESGKGKENPILSVNNFAEYILERYGFFAKGASVGPMDIPGDAGTAISAPYIARQLAEADAIRGEGEGRAEANRLLLEAKALKESMDLIGVENAVALRTADVAEQFATSGKSNTVVLGFDPKTFLGTVLGGAVPKRLGDGGEGNEPIEKVV